MTSTEEETKEKDTKEETYKKDTKTSTKENSTSTTTSPIYQGTGAEGLLQFNGYYKIGVGTFINLEANRYYSYNNEGKQIYADLISISYSLDGTSVSWVRNGDVTYDKNSAVLMSPRNYLVASFTRGDNTFYLSSDPNALNGHLLTKVALWRSSVPFKGANLLNYIPLKSFAGTYGALNLEHMGIPSMSVSKHNGWSVSLTSKTPVKLNKFTYYSGMFTLGNEIPSDQDNSCLVFLGTGKQGLLAFMTSRSNSTTSTNLLCATTIKYSPTDPSPAITSKQTAYVLSEYNGYYPLSATNSFFSVYTQINYSQSDPEGAYVITLTYSVDGINVQAITKPLVQYRMGGNSVTISTPVENGISTTVTLKRETTYDPKTGILTYITGDLGYGYNTTNMTPINYFAANYPYTNTNANTFTIEIKNDTTVYLTNVKDNKQIQIFTFTWSGAMYLLDFVIPHTTEKVTIMMGVSQRGLVGYVMTKGIPYYYMYATKPPSLN